MKRIGTTALALALAACSTDYVYVHGGPNPGDDGGTPLDDSGNPVAPDTSGPPPTATPVDGLAVTDIAVFQGVKSLIFHNGASALRNAPVVANRPALVRVYATTSASYTAKPVVGYLSIQSSVQTVVLKDTKTIKGAWDENDATTLFQFLVPAGALQTDSTFSVELVDPSLSTGPKSSSPAQYPSDGSTTSLGVKSSGAQLKIWFWPVVTNGLTPPSDAGFIKSLQDLVYQLYPTPDVQITVKSPVSYPGAAPQANGSNWSTMLQWFTNKRQSDGAPNDVYYYGSFTPDASFGSYCGGGCVAGLSSLAQNIADVWARCSIGLGYSGAVTTETAFTMAHEVGHAHGRAHAPCGGAQQVDPGFPYSSGGSGVWGYGLIDQTFIDPTMGHDMMGYCPQSEWISDYTYSALFDRLAAVNGASIHYPPEQLGPREYRIVDIAADGSLTWGSTVTATVPVYGEEHTVSYLGSDGKTIKSVTGYYYGYDHLPGGYMLVPAAPGTATQMQIADFGAKAVVPSH